MITKNSDQLLHDKNLQAIASFSYISETNKQQQTSSES